MYLSGTTKLELPPLSQMHVAADGSAAIYAPTSPTVHSEPRMSVGDTTAVAGLILGIIGLLLQLGKTKGK